MIAALSYRINKNCIAKIYQVGTYAYIDWENYNESCELGVDYSTYDFKKEGRKSVLKIERGMNEVPVLRLTETKQYIVKIECDNDSDLQKMIPRLPNSDNKFVKYSIDEDSATFQFVNYLGRSRFIFWNEGKEVNIPFEVVPDKINYENDYIELTEALANQCEELLLEFSGATSNVYSLSDIPSESLMEQFIFVRKFCYADNIQGLIESIKRNPDRLLKQEEQFRSLGYGRPSNRFYSNPFKYGRNWQKAVAGHHGDVYLPQAIAVTDKLDDIDTPANRFIKYALEVFEALCEKMIRAINEDGASKQTECLREAKHIRNMLSDLMLDPFFMNIGPLDIMPQNNQVLLKREGYSQIFKAFSMLDLAMKLDWKGKDEVYEGESKNVALLYEYWLFFVLEKMVASINGCQKVECAENPFVTSDKGQLVISLAEGKTSCQSFDYSLMGLRINLYYNRSFTRREFSATRYEGSYSRPFRPDYTLAIFPDAYSRNHNNGEMEAIKDGTVSYIHFDAKYRVTDLTSFLGKDNNSEADYSQYKADEVMNTYKRGDLLKMHTYNDAIRRTIGSYVLYPGGGVKAGAINETFSMYDEILPGVGAFSIKPSNLTVGQSELKKFIVSVLKEKSRRSTRLNRLKYYSEMILREPALKKENSKSEIVKDMSFAEKENCILGYIRAEKEYDYYYFLEKSNKFTMGAHFSFYFYAIKGTSVYSHHKEVMQTKKFRFYCNDIRKENIYKLSPVLCEVESCELISKDDLVERLVSEGYETSTKKHNADFYYVLNLRVIEVNLPETKIPIREVNSVNGNDSFSPHSPKLIPNL